MSRFYQRLREDLRDLEFAEAFYKMRKALNINTIKREDRRKAPTQHHTTPYAIRND